MQSSVLAAWSPRTKISDKPRKRVVAQYYPACIIGMEQVELSHEEVWDDSALIDSWNEALAEYKV